MERSNSLLIYFFLSGQLSYLCVLFFCITDIMSLDYWSLN